MSGHPSEALEKPQAPEVPPEAPPEAIPQTPEVPEEIKETPKQRRARKLREKNRRYYAKNREKVLAKSKESYQGRNGARPRSW